jgi:hypothetical protein
LQFSSLKPSAAPLVVSSFQALLGTSFLFRPRFAPGATTLVFSAVIVSRESNQVCSADKRYPTAFSPIRILCGKRPACSSRHIEASERPVIADASAGLTIRSVIFDTS